VVCHKHARIVQKDLHAKRLGNVLNLNHETKNRFLREARRLTVISFFTFRLV
jgi:hypothetical protein